MPHERFRKRGLQQLTTTLFRSLSLQSFTLPRCHRPDVREVVDIAPEQLEMNDDDAAAFGLVEETKDQSVLGKRKVHFIIITRWSVRSTARRSRAYEACASHRMVHPHVDEGSSAADARPRKRSPESTIGLTDRESHTRDTLCACPGLPDPFLTSMLE